MENLKKVKETILELIYPSKCPFCGEIVSAGNILRNTMESARRVVKNFLILVK